MSDNSANPQPLSTAMPRIENMLDGQVRLSSVGGAPVLLDVGSDAVVTDGDGIMTRLSVFVRPEDASATDLLGFRQTAGQVELLNGTEVHVDGTKIADLSIDPTSGALDFILLAAATTTRVQKLIRALTYTNQSTDPAYAAQKDVIIQLSDQEGSTTRSAQVNVHVTIAPSLALTTQDDVLAGGTGEDTFTAGANDIGFGDDLDGGAGTDTLQLNGGGNFFLNTLAGFANIEVISGSATDDAIHISGDQLQAVMTIDGGGNGTNGDSLVLHGASIDLTGITINQIQRLYLSDNGATVTLDDLDTAKLIRATTTSNDKIVLNQVLSAEDRLLLHRNGFDIVQSVDGNGDPVSTTHHAPQFGALGGDRTVLFPDHTIYLDANSNATLTADDGLLKWLLIGTETFAEENHFGFDTSSSSRVRLPDGLQQGGQVVVIDPGTGQNVSIGTLDVVHGASLVVMFNDQATPERVQILVRAATFTFDGILQNDIPIIFKVQDAGGRETTTTVTVAHSIVMTAQAETLTGGSDDDTFFATSEDINAGDSIDGAGGNDTLVLNGGGDYRLDRMTGLTGIETIHGSANQDNIYLTSTQLSGIHHIDGGAGGTERLRISGSTVDLRGKEIAGFYTIGLLTNGATFIFDDKGTALNATGHDTTDDKLILETPESVWLTVLERQSLHRRGIETVVARDEDGVVRPSTVLPPMMNLGGLDGDRVNLVPGQSAKLDLGGNAIVTATRPISEIKINILGESEDFSSDQVGLVTSDKITLSDGMNNSSRIFYQGVEIGEVSVDPGIGVASLSFYGDGISAAIAQDFIRALTYSSTSSSFVSAALKVTIGTEDLTSTAQVTVEKNAAPTDLNLAGGSVLEMTAIGTLVGTLSAQDPNIDDSFTYSLLDSAGGRFKLDGNRLVVADGIKLDYEQAASHAVTVRVADKGGLTRDMTFMVQVGDVAGETATGTAGNDVLAGGVGNDRIFGAAGDDQLSGGIGDDWLVGGVGRDKLAGNGGKDVFVFDSAVAKKNNTNFDAITDFSVRDDSIYLENAIYKGLGRKGSPSKPAKLSKDAFWKGNKAHDASDRIIYDSRKGVLYYDEDGNGRKAAIKIATLEKNLKITEKDLFVI